ncbi:MAG TPA: vitamin K epoxide reductase family protein [Caulifigura sp.]|nr:vitamin K epoxide reductase family protein [Caulifigura sp.]
MTSASTSLDRGRLRTATVVLAVAAAGVATYLGIVSLQLRGTPWGCGAGSGCADVLKSRWSNVAGIPVGFFAMATYTAIALLALWGRKHPGPLIRNALTILAAAVMSTAIYFVVMQVAVLKAICPWCMVDHALGVGAALGALAWARIETPRRPGSPVAPSGDPLSEYDSVGDITRPALPERRPSAIGSVIAGVMLSLGFVVLQHVTARAPDVARVESGLEQVGEGSGLTLTLKNGEATLPIAALPVIGSPAAPQTLVLLFDYCCPHCREAHGVIRQLHVTAAVRWKVVFVPAPLSASCNPAIEETEERFRDACDLARVSLAVWKLKPTDWPTFDAWLFEPELPRTAREAREHASALYGEIEVAEALIDPSLEAAIKADVAAYRATGSPVLPVILSPGSQGIAGRTETAAELQQLLRSQFGFPDVP